MLPLADEDNDDVIFTWKRFIRIYFTISIIHKTVKSKPGKEYVVTYIITYGLGE